MKLLNKILKKKQYVYVLFIISILLFLFLTLENNKIFTSEGFGLKKHITLGTFIGDDPIKKQNTILKLITSKFPELIKNCKQKTGNDQMKCKDDLMLYIQDSKKGCDAFLHKNNDLKQKCHNMLYEPVF